MWPSTLHLLFFIYLNDTKFFFKGILSFYLKITNSKLIFCKENQLEVNEIERDSDKLMNLNN